MASEVDICNLALSNIGDRATVASIDPPEGSVQAEHCARFYPVARDALLELHEWGFATRQILLAELTGDVYGWDHSYAQPADLIKPIEILSDNTVGQVAPCVWGRYENQFAPSGPIEFSREIDAIGRSVIYSNKASAVLRYVRRVEDTTMFSPLFLDALTWRLSAMLAGPVIKGAEGAQESKRCMQVFMSKLAEAKLADTQGRRVKPVHTVGWMTGR